MILQSPLKRGTTRAYWTHDLTSLKDLFGTLTQGFGSNPDIYGQFVVPLPGGGTGPMKGHNGLDFSCPDGTEVFASHDGIVDYAGTDDHAGLGIVIKGNGLKTIYWHLRDFSVIVGASVKKGDLIGYSDNTGFSTGPHLHYGLKLLDANGQVLNRDNGYDGAVDPTQYLVWHNNMITQAQIELLYTLLDINDPDGSGRAFWVGKPLDTFLIQVAKDKVAKLTQLTQ